MTRDTVDPHHGIQVGKAVDKRWLLGKFLSKRIAQVVCRVWGVCVALLQCMLERVPVEMMRTLLRTLASCTARLLLVVVLPTPPLPPTKTHFSDV